MKQSVRIRMQQPKNNAFFGVGDIVKGKCKDGSLFQGEITCVDIKKQKNELHAIIDINPMKGLHKPELEPSYSIWVENIEYLEILYFKGELSNVGKE